MRKTPKSDPCPVKFSAGEPGPFVGFTSVLAVPLAQFVFRYSLAALKFVFKGSPPALVQAGLLISPHTSAWAASPCMTHVAIKNVHFDLLSQRWDYLM